MRKKNGFTLIEILSVIIIIGVIMIIAVPAVTKYIFKTNKSVYASDVSAFVETVRAEYEMKTYGSLLKDDEIMVVPIEHVVFEKGDSNNSPYGEYDFNKSHVLIVPERNAYSYYATVIDSANVGLVNKGENEISEDVVQEDISASIQAISTYDSPESMYIYNGKSYKRSDVRTINVEELDESYRVYVFKDTGLIEKVKVMKLFSHLGESGTLEHYYGSWRLNGEVVTSVAVPTRTGYTFQGYHKGQNETGLKVINETGKIVTDIEEQLGDYTVAFAYFTANPLIFNDVSPSIYFSNSDQQIAITEATNGTGNYTYTEVSEKNSSGTNTNYFSVSGTRITVAGNTPVGTYTYVVNAKDNNSLSTKDATYRIIINKSDAICPTTTATTATYDGLAHTIGISGGSGGTIQYSTNNSTWSTTNPTRIEVGTQTTYVKVVGDTNHNDKTCTSKTLTISKKALTITAKNQTITYGSSITTGVGQVTVNGLVNGDSLTGVTLTQSTTNATTSGTITPSDAATTKGIENYSVTYNTGTLTINKKALTISAKNQTITYGSSITTGVDQATASGLISGDSLTGVTLTPSTANATTSGTITPSAATTTKGIENYNVTYNTGTLTINKKALTITAKAQTITYGSSIATGVGQVTASGLVSGDSLTAVSLKQSTTNATTNGTITPSAGATSKGIGNYSVTYNTGKLTINKVDPVCPTTSNTSVSYDGKPHSIGVSGGSGGTIQYSTNNSTWNTTNPTRTEVGSQTTYVRVSGDSNHNTKGCTARTITIIASNPGYITITKASSHDDYANNVYSTSHPVFRDDGSNAGVYAMKGHESSTPITCHNPSGLTCSSGNTSIATCRISGGRLYVTGVSRGTTTITLTCPASGNYTAKTVTYSFKSWQWTERAVLGEDCPYNCIKACNDKWGVNVLGYHCGASGSSYDHHPPRDMDGPICSCYW